MDAILNDLQSFFSNTWIFIPFFGASVFIAALLGGPYIYNYFSEKTLASKAEIERYLDLMYSDLEPKKVLWMLLLMSYGLGFVVFLAFWPNVQFGFPLAIAMIFVGNNVPVKVFQNMYEKRCTRIVDQMVDGMTIMANGIKSGSGVMQSMEAVVENIKGPLAQEFSMILNKIRLGMSMNDAMNEFADRVPRQDVQMFVTSVNILSDTGGDLGQTFETINNVVRERQKIEKKIEAMTAQGKAQGVIISMVPFGLLLLFRAMDPEFVAPLFNTTMGMIALLVVCGLVIIGGFVIKKIVTIKV